MKENKRQVILWGSKEKFELLDKALKKLLFKEKNEQTR